MGQLIFFHSILVSLILSMTARAETKHLMTPALEAQVEACQAEPLPGFAHDHGKLASCQSLDKKYRLTERYQNAYQLSIAASLLGDNQTEEKLAMYAKAINQLNEQLPLLRKCLIPKKTHDECRGMRRLPFFLPFANRSALLSNRASASSQKSDWAQAKADADLAVFLNPEHPAPWAVRGTALAGMRQFETAATSLSVALQLVKSPREAALYWNALGRVRYSARQYPEAMKAYNKALSSLRPDGTSSDLPLRFFAKVENNRGVTLRAMGRFSESMEALDHAAVLDPASPMIIVNQGRTHVGLLKFKLAKTYFDRALRLAPQDPNALFHRGMYLAFQKMPKSALQDFSKLENIAPRHTYGILWQYLLLRWIGEGNLADRKLQRFLSSEHNFYSWPTLLARFFQGQVTEEQLIQTLTSQKKTLPQIKKEQLCEAYFYLSWYFGISGAFDKASHYRGLATQQKTPRVQEYILAEIEAGNRP